MTEDEVPARKPLSFTIQILMLIVFCFLGIMLFSMLGMTLSWFLFKVNFFTNQSLLTSYSEDWKVVNANKFVQACLTFGTFAVPAAFFITLQQKFYRNYFRLDVQPQGIFLILILFFVLGLQPFINYLAEVNNSIHFPSSLKYIEDWLRSGNDKTKDLEKMVMAMPSWRDLCINLIIIAFLPALCEEIMFRGLLQRLIGEHYKNIHIGIWISAFVFSFIHFDFLGFIPRFVIGALFGYIFYWTGSLWITILAHFVNNGFVVILYYFADRNETAKYILETESFPAWANIVSIVVSTVLFLFFYGKRVRGELYTD